MVIVEKRKTISPSVLNPKVKLVSDRLKRIDEKAVEDRVAVPVVVNSAVIPQFHVHPVAGRQLQNGSVAAAV